MPNKKEYSSKQEQKIADYLDWKQVTGSGSRPTFTGDVENSEWLGECKTHVSSGHKIFFDSKVLDKIVSEAAAKFKQPAYFVDDGSQNISKTWVMFLDRDVSSRFVIEEYPFKISNTITFDHLELSNMTSDQMLYRLTLGKYKVLLTKLDIFYALVM